MQNHNRIKELRDFHYTKALRSKNSYEYFKTRDLQRSQLCFNYYLYHKKKYDQLQTRVIYSLESTGKKKDTSYEIPINLKKITPIDDLKTNWFRHSITYDELYKIKPKDEIEAIVDPIFVDVRAANKWLEDNQPVVVVQNDGRAKGYPLQVLLWHEVINDIFEEMPIVVTYSPLTNGVFVYSRKVEERTLVFGTSGIIEKSSTIMYDRETESLWQTFTGDCVVGDLAGNKLDNVLQNTVPFYTFAKAYPEGLVILSNETGHIRKYGQNPYIGYEESRKPFFFTGEVDTRLPVMERVVGLIGEDNYKAYAYSILEKEKIIEDQFEDKELVIFYTYGMASVLDAQLISSSKDIGAIGVFRPFIEDKKLTFYYKDNSIFDVETNSEWDLLGTAIRGYYKGKTLEWVLHSSPFWFAWAAYYPQTMVYDL